MALNKKGMVFTLITIVILSLFIISYSTYSIVKNKNVVNSRITTLNNFVASVEQDLPRQIFISGYRAIFLIEKNMLDEGKYTANVNNTLNELFFNGTLNETSQPLMDDAIFSVIQTFLEGNADKINAEIQLLDPTISISQSDPWNLKITLNTTLIINDKGNLVSWNKSSSIDSLIPIKNFEDPLYLLNTQGKVTNKINQSPYQIFVTGADYTNLTNHFQNSLYIHSTSAPNFLMRLEGNLNADPNGIESMVHPQKLIDQGVTPKYKSVIDYIYFGTSDPAKYTVPSVSNLILDDEDNHLTIYNVSGVAVPA
ncbi:hypothetical protein HN682_03750 [Candidatus Peregrinibacteria bacterium]|jgi:hypothetical protein|nr:hypothetical protein [Candidatus Peregrinibacteria bacterium]